MTCTAHKHVTVANVREWTAPKPVVMTVPADLPYATDKYGFPVENCSRCDGLGYLPHYRHVMNGVCAKCSGRKTNYPRGKAGDIAREFYATLRERSRANSTNIVVGDVVVVDGAWKTVTAVLPTISHRGYAYKGTPGTAGYEETNFYAVVVRFADGTEKETCREVWKRRAGITANDAMLAAVPAREAYEKVLKRRRK